MTIIPSGEFPAHIRRFDLDDGPFEAYRLKADECDVLCAAYPKGSVIEPHRHDDTEIVGVVTKGLVHLTVNDVERSYRPGDWFHVPVSAEHTARYEETTVEIEFLFRV
jgi:quercetin dioxygenase-like cupin family protein